MIWIETLYDRWVSAEHIVDIFVRDVNACYGVIGTFVDGMEVVIDICPTPLKAVESMQGIIEKIASARVVCEDANWVLKGSSTK